MFTIWKWKSLLGKLKTIFDIFFPLAFVYLLISFLVSRNMETGILLILVAIYLFREGY